MTKAQGQKRRAHGMVPLAGPQSAQMHSGIGSSVKPAYEPVVVARKPLSEKNLVQNILKHGEWLEDGTVYKVGTGGLNIDASRVGTTREVPASLSKNKTPNGIFNEYGGGAKKELNPNLGRFPSNTLWSHVPGPNGCVRVGSRRVKNQGGVPKAHTQKNVNPAFTSTHETSTVHHFDPDGLEEVAAWECQPQCPVRALDEQSGQLAGRGSTLKKLERTGNEQVFGTFAHREPQKQENNGGGASRFFSQFHEPDPSPGFFYTSKASRAERNRGLEGMPEKAVRGGGKAFGEMTMWNGENGDAAWKAKNPNKPTANNHPTVKSLSLMKYLLKLVTPPGGTTLDPFAGSGTSGVAALSEGFNAILIEAEPEYCEIAERRCAHALSERVEPEKKPKLVESESSTLF